MRGRDQRVVSRLKAVKLLLDRLHIDTSIIHGTLVVIANEVKQSSKTKMHFFKPSGLPRRLRLLMELLVERLAIPLSNHKTVAKWLVISRQAGKSLVIAMTGVCAIARS
ncbi:MAG: hypothetical protein AWT59_0701 [Candidatus Gallionella acididurans]|uniref:Uncharacterized protein n=1 Tax=Candidatus Gallionella acididurans TaxID=1796491 RepID=A0A139BVX7_9PROT|nr:MAG: hypothetical protein AWT59_0701 [Candidatus Gallionella acididurans]